MRCPICEQPVAENGSFCPYCGHVFDAARANAEAQQLERRARRAAEIETAPRRRAEGASRDFEGEKAFDAGSLLAAAFDVFARHAVTYVGLTALLLAPSAILAAAMEFAALGDGSASSGGSAPVSILLVVVLPAFLTVICEAIATGAITFSVVEDARGETVSGARSLAVGFARGGTVLLVAVLSGVLTSLGYVLLCVPGFIISTVLSVAVPVAVLEGVGPFEALSRSGELTRGYRWPIFGVLLLLGIVESISVRVTGKFGNAFPAMIAVVVYGVADLTVTSLVTAVRSSIVATIYHRLRLAKEAVSPEEITRTFALHDGR